MKIYTVLFVQSICTTAAFSPSAFNTRNDWALFVSGAASDLLYQEQENLIIKRGELEEQMMSKNVKPIEEASKSKMRGTGSAGGFGGGSGGKSSKKSALKAQAKTYSKILKKDGVVRINNVLSGETADLVRDFVYDLRKKSEDEVKAGTIPPLQRFADVLLKKDRCDLTIPVGDEIISTALNEVLRGSAVGQTISSTFSENAILHELSCLISDPGSQRQVLHPDTPVIPGKGPVLFTCFIALQDVRLDMGPTTWLPKTHKAEVHETFKDTDSSNGESKKDALIRKTPAVLGTLSKGSCAIFDSRCIHCGTANKSKDSRALFYFSFKNPEIGYTGNPPSIRPEMGQAQITLKALEDDLESRSKGKGQPFIDSIAATLR